MPNRRPDNIAIEFGFDRDALCFEHAREVSGPPKSLFLAVEACKDDGGVKMYRCEKPREFYDHRDRRSVIIRSRCIERSVVHIGIARIIVTRYDDRSARRIITG